jgi:hypothetical protein
MYVLKAKPWVCAPRSSQAGQPRTTKIGMTNLGRYPTFSADFSYGWFTGAVATVRPIHVEFVYFISFSAFFDRATNRTADRYCWLMAQTTCSHVMKCLLGAPWTCGPNCGRGAPPKDPIFFMLQYMGGGVLKSFARCHYSFTSSSKDVPCWHRRIWWAGDCMVEEFIYN